MRSGEPEDPQRAAGWLAPAGHVRERVEREAALTRDALPLLGRVPGAPALVAAGFGGAALGLAFEAARWLAEAAAGRDAIAPHWRADRI
jgi:glycine/D-amino acid oxidase-like deaminating enzyme